MHSVQEKNFMAQAMTFATCLEPYTLYGLTPLAGLTDAVYPGCLQAHC